MLEIYLKNPAKIKQKRKFLEDKLKLKIEIKNSKAIIDGDSLKEYETSIIFDAINFGFSIESSMLLEDPRFSFRELHIKDYTRKKNLEPVRARLIGKHGKTRKTIEEISGCKIKIADNFVGILGPTEEMEYAITAITNLIRGSKQSNVYNFLERINKKEKEKD